MAGATVSELLVQDFSVFTLGYFPYLQPLLERCLGPKSKYSDRAVLDSFHVRVETAIFGWVANFVHKIYLMLIPSL
jgi:hypothetical protein